MELEIRPLLLVPDTNCFIDHLNGIKTLLACGRYTIVVPLVGKYIGGLTGSRLTLMLLVANLANTK